MLNGIQHSGNIRRLKEKGDRMPLLGQAALAMWWDMDPAVRADFEDWHAHEHFPERLAIPGFRRGTRWRGAAGGDGVFVMYEMESHETLSSAPYLARLNAPSPWSTRMMPHHRNMVRSQCRVLESGGGAVARHALTLRLSPAVGRGDEVRAWFRPRIGTWITRPGVVGAHLLRHEPPPIAATTEQKIRGASDQVADWVFVACGYDRAALEQLAEVDLAAAVLEAHGVAPGQVAGVYTVSYSATPGDVA
jgi:hypothetical protein